MPETEATEAKAAAAEASSPALAKPGFTATQFSLFFGVLIFAAFPQVVLGLATFVSRDFGFFAYPLAHYQRECFWRGELPLWNPYNYCGVPFLAQWNSMPLYPPALLYLILPLTWSLGVFSLLHLFWAGLGMYFLARRWTGDALAASVAGVIFGFNGFSLNLLMWPSHIATFSWMPWVLLVVERACREGGVRVLAAACVGSLQMLAGGPETIFFTWLVGIAVWVAVIAAAAGTDAAKTRLKIFCRFPLVVLLVIGLCAIQLFPFLDLAAHSQRQTGFADARWCMPNWGWANLLVPMVFGTTFKQGLFFQSGQYWTSSYYLGIPALLLALVGLQGKLRHWRVWLLAGAAVTGLVLATGDQTLLSSWARHLVPQLSLITYPVKFVTFTVFAIPLLAAFGIVQLQQSRSTGLRRLLGFASFLLLAIAGVLVWARLRPLPTDNFAHELRNGLSRIGILAAGVVILFLVVKAPEWFSNPTAAQRGRTSPFSAQGLWLVLLVVLWVDVWTHEPQQNPAVPSWVYQPNLARDKAGFAKDFPSESSRLMVSPKADARFRSLILEDPKDNFLVKRTGFFADCNLLDGVSKVDGFFSLTPAQCGELYSTVYVSEFAFGEGLQDFMSVSHINAADDPTSWRARTNWMPLVTAGQVPVFLDDTNALLTILSAGFDPRRVAVLPLEAKAFVSVRSNVAARVKLQKVAAERIDFEVSAESPTLGLIGQTFYHPWRAFVDGKPQEVLRANYAFQAIQAPAGTHQVSLIYDDQAFHWGGVLSTLTAAGLVISWGLRLSRKRGAVRP